MTRIDASRLLGRLDELGRIGATANGGVTRLAYSAEDVAGRNIVAGWMRTAGLEVELDAAANLIGRTDGTGPALVLGSHIDTVVDGGRLDGSYGVLAAIEVAAALRAHSSAPRHRIIVVAFANEEGARGSTGFDGSRTVIGRPNPLQGTDRDGRTLAARLAAAGGRPGDLASAAWDPGSVAAYLELHIEQGPVLEAAGVALGVVTGITGRRNIDVTVVGAANHAGTTPMDGRRDALTTAARIVLAVEQLPARGLLRVATTGALEVFPDVRNVVAGRARLGLDLRDLDESRLDAAVVALRVDLAAIATTSGTTITVELAGAEIASPTDERVMAAFDAAAAASGLPALRLVSGAGHDAQVMAELGPIGMLFVPSRRGVSHSPFEHTNPRDLASGAAVFLDAVERLDRSLPT